MGVRKWGLRELLLIAGVGGIAWAVRRKTMNPFIHHFPPAHARNTGGEPLPTRSASEPLVGYRTWRLRNRGGYFALHSLMQYYEWKTENTARCLPSYNNGGHDDDAPSQGCACGFYCQLPEHPLDEWESHVRGRIRATGTVAMSGRIIKCELGYKAQHATIQSPVVIDVDCGSMKCSEPPTKVKVGTSPDYWTYCDEHATSQRDDDVFVDLPMFLEQMLSELRRTYPEIEFYTFAAI